MGVLTGYRVLDCSTAMAGPFAAQRLGDLAFKQKRPPVFRRR
jgi:crotonobetainyl-CoA:carnitine CoA-transferase CaiB-like acyl-CoA transferase